MSVALPVEIDKDIALIVPGPLQLAILAVLWRFDRASLTAIHRTVNLAYKPIALSSLSTTITRLLRRGWITRPKPGQYRAAISRQQLIDLIAEHIEQA